MRKVLIYIYASALVLVFGELAAQTTTVDQGVVDNFGFQYRYDGRKRMTMKKVPGADWVYLVYDNRDRLVMSQDGNQRTNNEWTFIKYDQLNRPVLTGICKDQDGDPSNNSQEGM